MGLHNIIFIFDLDHVVWLACGLGLLQAVHPGKRWHHRRSLMAAMNIAK